MTRKIETAGLQGERVRLERTEVGELRLSWLREEANLPVQIYWSSQPQFEEREAKLIAETLGPSACAFPDPQPEGRSYYHIRLGDELLPPVAERIVPLQRVPNFRDMGGYAAAEGRRVQWGKLYRSAELARMTEWDRQYARSLGIVWICDLRTPGEVRRYPSPRISGELNENLSFMASADPGEMASVSADGMTINMLADANRMMVGNTELAALFLRRLLDQGGSAGSVPLRGGQGPHRLRRFVDFTGAWRRSQRYLKRLCADEPVCGAPERRSRRRGRPGLGGSDEALAGGSAVRADRSQTCLPASGF